MGRIMRIVLLAAWLILASALAAERADLVGLDDAASFMEQGEGIMAQIQAARATAKMAPKRAARLLGELLKAKQGGTTLDIKPVLAAITKLNNEIRDEGREDKHKHKQEKDECHKTKTLLEETISVKVEQMKNLRVHEDELHRLRKGAYSDRTVSKETERQIEKVLADLRIEKKKQMIAFLARRKKRRKDVVVLDTAVTLVCTFRSFKDNKQCLLHGVTQAVKNPPKPDINVDKPERDLEAEGFKAIRDHAAAWKTTVAADIQLASQGKVADTDQPNQSRALTFLQLGMSVPDAVVTLGKMLDEQASEQAASNVRALLISLKAGDYERSSSLLGLVVGLQKEIEETQHKDMVQTDKKQAEFQKQIVEQETQRRMEQAKQAQLWVDIQDYGVKVDQTRTAYFVSVAEMHSAEKEREENRVSCSKLKREYRNRRIIREEEMDNILRLKSLLRVLAGDDKLPTCEGDMKKCTKASQGQCVFRSRTDGRCVCEWEHYGAACQNFKCPGTDDGRLYTHAERDACNGADRGSCDRTTGKCKCKDDFYGDEKRKSCQFVKKCPGGGNCSDGQGTCSKHTGKCTCKAGRFGKGCEHKMCPGSGPNGMRFSDTQAEVCSSHGICEGKTGTCVCHQGWHGFRCDQKKCPDDCSARGTCNPVNGKCLCNSGYHGLSCEWNTCPANCGGTSSGECDRDSGKCVCRAGYSGKTCGRSTTCDKHTTTFKQWSMFRKGWSKCPYGWLMTGVKTGSCTSIECLERARCARPCFGNQRLTLGDCYQANWWKSFNKSGWSKCRDPYFLAGLYRNKCTSLYCIEVGYCCTVRQSSYTQCGEHTWTEAIKQPNHWAEVPGNRFITGFWREGKDATIHDMKKAAHCNFKRDDDAQ